MFDAHETIYYPEYLFELFIEFNAERFASLVYTKPITLKELIFHFQTDLKDPGK